MPIVSFDFDGVIHQNVKIDQVDEKGNILTYGPLQYETCLGYYTHPLIIETIYKEAKKNDLVIVTGRKAEQGKALMQYLRKMGLSKIFKAIYFCPNGKVEKLREIGAILHYEDSPKHLKLIKEAGIKVITVYPRSSQIFKQDGFQ